MILKVVSFALGAIVLLLWRIRAILPHSRSPPPRKRNPTETCSLGVFLGSGGHTAEMQTLLSAIPLDRYTPRTYFYCPPDEISLRVIQRTEDSSKSHAGKYTIVPLPRARRVGEGKLSTLVSATKTLLVAVDVLFWRPLLQDWRRPVVDVLLINGPGTCVVLVLVSYIRRILGLSHTRIIYIESFARVNTLSLSGKILRGLVDTFVVQWPDAATSFDKSGGLIHTAVGGGRAKEVTYKGWLV